jgi:hypothetical protein
MGWVPENVFGKPKKDLTLQVIFGMMLPVQ